MRPLALILVAGSAAWAAPGGFGFHVPDGWTNLSPDAPADERQKAPPELLEQVRKSGQPFFAADLAHGDDGFVENMNAAVLPGSLRVTLAALDLRQAALEAELAKQGMSFHVLDKSLVKIGGVSAGRMVGQLDMNGMLVKEILYYLPGRRHHAILTFGTVPEKFAGYAPVFDAAAAATTGLVEPSRIIDWEQASERVTQTVLAATAIALVIWLKRNRRHGV